MDLTDADLAKTLECPVCLDVFDEPKLLICGHTVCRKCVKNVVEARRNEANARQGRDRNCLKCPVCTTETEIPPEGLTTNYSLVDLVCRVQKSLVDACACNGCGKKAPVADTYTCETCEEALNCKPLWICAGCALKQHRDHALSECNKATQQQIEEACQGIASSGRSADVYVCLTMSHLNRAQKETELISQLLNQQKGGFARLEARLKRAVSDLAQEDLAASVQAATDLKQKFAQASIFATETGKSCESALHDCREKLEDLFPTTEDEDPMDSEDSGTSRNKFDLSSFDDGQQAIELRACRIDAIPDLSRFSQLQFLAFRVLDLHDNRITEIRGLDALVNLETLAISCNRLSKIQGLASLVKLKHIDLEHNLIERIEGLETLVNLEVLALNDNRIKAIENLDGQRNLSELYLDKNRIRKLENVSHLTKLIVLSVEGNRIAKLENLETLADLEELYVSEQGIETFDGIQKLNKLKRIDADQNIIAGLDHLDHLQQLENLWLNDNRITQWPEVDKLATLAKLRTVRLYGNPIETQNRDDYRRKVIRALQQVTHVDGAPCR